MAYMRILSAEDMSVDGVRKMATSGKSNRRNGRPLTGARGTNDVGHMREALNSSSGTKSGSKDKYDGMGKNTSYAEIASKGSFDGKRGKGYEKGSYGSAMRARSMPPRSVSMYGKGDQGRKEDTKAS
eukprot:4303303-Amphidinium_carterae.1